MKRAVDLLRFTFVMLPATGNGLGDAVTGVLAGELPRSLAEMAVTEYSAPFIKLPMVQFPEIVPPEGAAKQFWVTGIVGD